MDSPAVVVAGLIYFMGMVYTYLMHWTRSDTVTLGLCLMWPVILAILIIKGSVLAIYYALLGKL